MPSITLPVAILGAGTLAAGAGLASGLIGSSAAKSAANTQAQAAQTAANTQLGIYNQTRSDLMPYNITGQSALSQLASMFGLGGANGGVPNAAAATSALTQFPGYQFGLNQGVTALNRSAASRGLLLSGAQLKDAQTYGQGYALQNAWTPYVQQLNSLSGLGENAGAVVGNQGVQTGANVGANQLAAGQATASGIVGSSNALTGGINTGINTGLNSALLAYQLQQMQPGASLQLANQNAAATGAPASALQYAFADKGNTMKPRIPKLPKTGGGGRVRIRGGSTAFGAGGNRAFRDPQTMVAPDQAFSAAMAAPQGGAAPSMPAGPMPPPVPTSQA